MDDFLLSQEILNYAATLEADFAGIADLTPAHSAILEQGGPEVACYSRAISLGIRLMDPIVEQLPRRAERAVRVSYRHHAYDVVNDRLDEMASRMASHLQRLGHAAFPVPASKRVDDQRICSFFSHKVAAHLAGLGWIGKSCLLITPQVGPRVRWTTVLTNAPLHPSGEPMEQRCGDCTACTDICPVEAITGRAFDPREPREVRLDARKCDQYLNELEKSGPPICGMCLYICPYGQN